MVARSRKESGGGGDAEARLPTVHRNEKRPLGSCRRAQNDRSHFANYQICKAVSSRSVGPGGGYFATGIHKHKPVVMGAKLRRLAEHPSEPNRWETGGLPGELVIGPGQLRWLGPPNDARGLVPSPPTWAEK
jgi:hypothetical protein